MYYIVHEMSIIPGLVVDFDYQWLFGNFKNGIIKFANSNLKMSK